MLVWSVVICGNLWIYLGILPWVDGDTMRISVWNGKVWILKDMEDNCGENRWEKTYTWWIWDIYISFL
jgi:hypothetical protein